MADEMQIKILMDRGMTEAEAREFMEGVHRGMKARQEGKVSHWSDVKKELGISDLICSLCQADPDIFCPRNVDAECLECGCRFCGAHIGEHLKQVHCISLTLDHCKKSPG